MHEECRYKSQVNASQPALLATEKAEEDLWISSKHQLSRSHKWIGRCLKGNHFGRARYLKSFPSLMKPSLLDHDAILQLTEDYRCQI